MTLATYTPTTTGTDEVILQRKVQGKMLWSFNKSNEERSWHSNFSDWKMAASMREVTTPVALTRGFGGASIVEGGYESVPATPAPTEATFTWIHENYRYSFTRQGELINQQGDKNQVFAQAKYQSMMQRNAMDERFSAYTYGYSTAVIAQTSTVATATSGTAYTLKNAYGNTALTNAAYIAQFFKVGQRVALRRAGALVANAIGTITATSAATPSITVTWIGSVTSANNDEVLYAHSQENATLSGGTDHNKAPIGFSDFFDTASVHGISNATYPLWTAGTNSSGGRMNFVKLRQAQNTIRNVGGGEPDLMVVAQGVEADMTDALLATNRYATTMGMQLDGSTAVKGVKTIRGSRWTPNGTVYLGDSSCLNIWEPAGQVPDENGMLPDSSNTLVMTDKLQDQSAKVSGADYLYSRVITNRGNMFRISALTEAY